MQHPRTPPRALRWVAVFGRFWSRALALSLGILLAVASGASCMDPVHTDAEDALGPEAPGIPEGPLHRAGQPCTVCHGGLGPGSPDFAAAGTVYDVRGSTLPLSGVTVILEDKAGRSWRTETNDVGNFYVTRQEFAPLVPMKVSLVYGGVTKPMETLIGRNGGCAVCHVKTGDASHMPAVYFREAP